MPRTIKRLDVNFWRWWLAGAFFMLGVLLITFLLTGDYRATTFTQQEKQQAIAQVDSLLSPVTADNVRELVFPPANRLHKYVAIEICPAGDAGCLTARQQLAVAAVKLHNGSLLGRRHTQEIAFYWLDPSNAAAVATLRDICGRIDPNPANGPSGLTMCAWTNDLGDWNGYGLVFYKLERPFSSVGGMMSGAAPMKWDSVPAILENFRIWTK